MCIAGQLELLNLSTGEPYGSHDGPDDEHWRRAIAGVQLDQAVVQRYLSAYQLHQVGSCRHTRAMHAANNTSWQHVGVRGMGGLDTATCALPTTIHCIDTACTLQEKRAAIVEERQRIAQELQVAAGAGHHVTLREEGPSGKFVQCMFHLHVPSMSEPTLLL